MSTVGAQSHRFSNFSSSTNTSNPRRLSAVPFTNSLVNAQFSDRRISVARDPPLSPREDEGTTKRDNMITIALAKAQNAVIFDNNGKFAAAIDAYSQCLAVLKEVISKESNHDDITRIRQIIDTYSVRMATLIYQDEPNLTQRKMPALPTRADLQDFEEEYDEDELLESIGLESSNDEIDALVASPPAYRYS